MITFSSAQLDEWIALVIFPLSRILALLATAPVFNNAALPVRVRLTVGLTVAMAVTLALPPIPPIPAGSWIGLAIIAQQILIGMAMGFALRMTFAAFDVAGEIISLQMGLSFATFYDPTSGGQTPVISEFLALMTALVFLGMNGHLLTLSVLAESFTLLPISATPVHAGIFKPLFAWSATLFATGLLLAMPMIATLLIVNIALGVLARIAQQLNLFAIGFPVTLALGFVVLMLSLPYIGEIMESLFSKGFQAMETVIRSGAA
ncbi:MAG TPA: flagellar biosynthetic protein FliR [Rhodocyclaceae bacterium]|nr:flagellar biosynthetic protein FliR [Rhodocyclaceae bacterium]